MQQDKPHIVEYFRDKAAAYDLVDQQPYWVFSDALLWEKLQAQLKELPTEFAFLDAGGGTGRWSHKVLQGFPACKGEIIDLSPDMLSEAEKKIKGTELESRLKITQGDLDKSLTPQVSLGKYDVIFSFHNVIGFVQDPSITIASLSEMLKPGGKLIILAPNLYHAIYFNISIGKVKDAQQIWQNKVGRFTKEMPDIHFFTPDQLKKIFEKSKLHDILVSGFPNTIYPGYLETQIEGSTTSLADTLSDATAFQELFEMELAISQQPDIAARGNNIFIVGSK